MFEGGKPDTKMWIETWNVLGAFQQEQEWDDDAY